MVEKLRDCFDIVVVSLSPYLLFICQRIRSDLCHWDLETHCWLQCVSFNIILLAF